MREDKILQDFKQIWINRFKANSPHEILMCKHYSVRALHSKSIIVG